MLGWHERWLLDDTTGLLDFHVNCKNSLSHFDHYLNIISSKNRKKCIFTCRLYNFAWTNTKTNNWKMREISNYWVFTYSCLLVFCFRYPLLFCWCSVSFTQSCVSMFSFTQQLRFTGLSLVYYSMSNSHTK